MARKAAKPAKPALAAPAAQLETDAVPDPAGTQPTFEEISRRAYALWEAAGKPEGEDQRFWFEAELELRRAK
jgi:hypothetical protein